MTRPRPVAASLLCHYTEANKHSQQRASAWSDSDDNSQLQMEEEQADRRPSDTESQVSGAASDSSEKQTVEQPVTPAASAAILMEALLALMQALKLSSTGSRMEIRPPNFNREGDLTLFFKRFEDVADANSWTHIQRTLHLCSQLAGDAQRCGHGVSYQEIVEDLHARFGCPRDKHATGWRHLI